jgi:hypothetical protein
MVVLGVVELLEILEVLEQVFKDCVKMFLENSLDIEEDQDRKEGRGRGVQRQQITGVTVQVNNR